MKKLILLLIAGLLAGQVAYTQGYPLTVYGNVWLLGNNNLTPAAGQAVTVFINDSLNGNAFYYQNTVYTDINGYYEDIVTVPNTVLFVQSMTYDSCLGYTQINGAQWAWGTVLPSLDFELCTVIVSQCQAMFTYINDPVMPLTQYFTNLSTGSFTEVFWDFGDSTYSTEFNPVHTYALPGIYFACLTVSDGLECTSVWCDFVYAGGNASGCENYFTYYYEDSTTVTFSGYLENGQQAASYDWEFGDGTTGSGQTVTHTFPVVPNGLGVFMVGLTTSVPDSNGTACVYTSFQEIWMQGGQTGCFNYFYYEQYDSTTFTFIGEAYLANGTTSDQTQYFWEFGDGTTATGQTVTHYFQPNPAQFYTVCLQTVTPVENGDTCVAYSCEDIWLIQPGFSIFGSVYLVNNMFADDATVRLMTMDTLEQGVTEVASVLLDSSGYYWFDNVPMYNSRLYFVQAELNEGSAWYGDYVPTYHYNAISWEYALPILPIFSWTADIFMVPSSYVNSGNGSISGTVSNLGTRGYLDGVMVVLMNEQMKPLYYTHSDENGAFTFGNLPMGSYVLHAEILGIHTNQAVVTLSEGQPEVAVEIQVTAGEANVVFGIGENLVSVEKAGNIYPNPVGSEARVEISLKAPTVVQMTVLNQTGMQLLSTERSYPAGDATLRLDVSNLPSGLYLLKVSTPDGDRFTRRFIRAR